MRSGTGWTVRLQEGQGLLIPSTPNTFFDNVVAQVPEPYREALLASIEKTVRQKQVWGFEMPFEKPSGERIWVRTRSVPERRETPKGEKLVYRGATIGITDRKEAKQAVKCQNELFARAQEIANVGAWEYGRSG